eukprot:CAMPEP_0204607008 /NCGR_PEP_ID=MMETSP0661-20131031/59438_1 /ASSEMBLY_ACC=CAM_ASM_000606 /TAXON_ID=109239 /ORGANISM="Alexandrium margalefi, Strain AMGDE01CS-322" /LENGTH=50 /DNA_ID=CAMNT_0051618379 /DNA_START=342 /DNA_END=491 /DNA_ORIENTATION=-
MAPPFDITPQSCGWCSHFTPRELDLALTVFCTTSSQSTQRQRYLKMPAKK